MDSLLTVICRQIYHWLAVSREMDQERKASVIYSVATDGHPVIYWTTNPLLARMCLDSYTKEMTNKQTYPSEVYIFLPIHGKISNQNKLGETPIASGRGIKQDFGHVQLLWLVLKINPCKLGENPSTVSRDNVHTRLCPSK